ncbi:MAG: flavodoxin [Clostridiales bacterium]|nr:flavodoxin [Clostridiales bacterium]
MPDVKKIALVSASPKVNQNLAVSEFLAKKGESLLKDERIEPIVVNVRRALVHKETQDAFRSMAQADAIVLIFPLYFFCMPAMLTRFLQDFAAESPKTDHAASVYAIVNCGFPEPEINREAMRVVERFAIRTGRTFLGGVMTGCGGMVLGAQGAPFMRSVMEPVERLFQRAGRDALADTPEPVQVDSVTVRFPRKLYFIAGNAGWRGMARKNKLKKPDLYRKPYER